MTSIYGFVLSYFVILPLAEKIERTNEKNLMNQKIIQEMIKNLRFS